MGAENASTVIDRPPRDNLLRAVSMPAELRAATGDDDSPVMVGHFARFNEWTEINSLFEGRFMERFAPGAFAKTITEQRDRMRVLFQHGMDPQVGDKPLGPIRDLEEDDDGPRYEVPLLDATYVRDLVLPGLEAKLYGASMRFRSLREEFEKEPGTSDHNPDGLPERTVKEAEVREFGPVTFPAYAGATAGVRSMTDEFLVGRLVQHPKQLRRLLEFAEQLDRRNNDDDTTSEQEGRQEPAEQDTAPPRADAGVSHLGHGRRDTRPPLYGESAGKETPSWAL